MSDEARARNNPAPIVLLYDFEWGRLLFPPPGEFQGCQLIADPRGLADAHVVIFHIPTIPPLEQIPKQPGQIWVAFCMESDVNYPHLSNLEFMKHFDLTMTYRLTSDIPALYCGQGTRDALRQRPLPKTESASTAYFASNGRDRCGRIGYVRDLMKYLQVDSYGKCLTNRKLPVDHGATTKLETIARYKFTLAFENSISQDYVTEKFFEPLIAGSVPVYRGAPNIKDFAPGEHCFINAADFNSPRELSEYLLYVAAHDAEYESYLGWKAKPFAGRFLETISPFFESAFVRLCSQLRVTKGRLESGPAQRDPIHKVARWLEGMHPPPGVEPQMQ
jgi:hypothetical protein